MISKYEYLDALEIVEEYHRQLKAEIKKQLGSGTNISNLVKGDFVVFSKVVKPEPINFTIGKEYEVLDVRKEYFSMKAALQIRNDQGGSYWIPVKNLYNRWSCR